MSVSPIANKFPYANKLLVSNYNGKVNDLIYSPNFVLILNTHIYSVKEISNIEEYFTTEPFTEGGNFDPIFTRNYFNTSFRTIVLRRPMPIRKSQVMTSVIRSALATAGGIFGGVAQDIARKAALIAASSLDPIATLEQGPAVGFIQVFDREYKNDVANFKFFSYGAEQWDAGNLDATSGEIIFESIQLVCSGFQRMSTTLSQSLFNIVAEDVSFFQISEEEEKELFSPKINEDKDTDEEYKNKIKKIKEDAENYKKAKKENPKNEEYDHKIEDLKDQMEKNFKIEQELEEYRKKKYKDVLGEDTEKNETKKTLEQLKEDIDKDMENEKFRRKRIEDWKSGKKSDDSSDDSGGSDSEDSSSDNVSNSDSVSEDESIDNSDQNSDKNDVIDNRDNEEIDSDDNIPSDNGDIDEENDFDF